MATLLVTQGSHFVRGPDGHVYARDGVTAFRFWSRYLVAFDRVEVAARVDRASEAVTDLMRADGEGVAFHDLPDYLGPWQYLLQRRALAAAIAEAVDRADAVCLRVPCAVGSVAWRRLRHGRRPFGVEVIADPWDALGPGTLRTIVRPIARRAMARDLRAQCREAAACAYVTRETLQRRYPPNADAYAVGFSSVELPEEAVINEPSRDFRHARRLILVGSLDVWFKGADILIRALACIGRPELHLTIVGSGRIWGRLKMLAESLGLGSQVVFTGALPPGAAVRAALDAADLFVMPSRTEGLPRAMVEAMARGLPCIGSDVGGIPELLASPDLVPPGDVAALADKIVEMLDRPERMREAAGRNLARARDFLSEKLAVQREAFYRELRRRCMAGASVKT